MVLDGELYAHAAPGLRDLRLLQGGLEVPYALEESFDESALSNPAGDRALYTTVLQIPLHASRLGLRDLGETSTPTNRGEAVLAAHVPAERIQLVPGPNGLSDAQRTPVKLSLSATPLTRGAEPSSLAPDSEVIDDVLPAASPVRLTAIGANLQNDARVSVAVSSEQFAVVLLQMRQRLLCFRPSPGLPLRMVFGNEHAKPVRYDSMLYYHPLAAPVLAHLGPVEPNPAYRSPAVHAPWWIGRRAVLLACALFLAFVLMATLHSSRGEAGCSSVSTLP